MQKKKLGLTFLVVALLCLTGCTKQLKGPDGKVVMNEETGQVLPSNILCAPTDEDILTLYRENKTALEEKYAEELEDGDIGQKEYDKKIKSIMDVDDYKSCDEFPVLGTGDGIWTSIFVSPLSWVLIKVGKFLGNYGLAIIFVTLLIRLIMYPVTLKTAKQSENLKKAKPEMDKLEKKYKNKKDQESMTRKAQEQMMLYKKYNINPFSGCLYSLLQIPLFFAFYEALYRLPVLFEDKLLSFEMSVSPAKGIGAGNWLYLILPVLVFFATYFSFKLNSGAGMSGDQAKQMKTTMNIMNIVITFMSFTMSSAIIFYWITNNTFTIIQNLIVKRSTKNDKVV